MYLAVLIQVYLILDEFICGGEIQETAKKVEGSDCQGILRAVSLTSYEAILTVCDRATKILTSNTSLYLHAGNIGAIGRTGQDRYISDLISINTFNERGSERGIVIIWRCMELVERKPAILTPFNKIPAVFVRVFVVI